MSEPGYDPPSQHSAPDDDRDGLSILGDLKSRRQQVIDRQVMTLAVPRWTDPVIKIKYKPIPHPIVQAVSDRVDKATKEKKAEVEVEGNADLLIRACVAVVAVIDDQEYSLRPGDPHGEPTKFDPDLAENLGLPRDAGARAVVRKIFLTDADILAAATAVGEFSGYKTQTADEEFVGES